MKTFLSKLFPLILALFLSFWAVKPLLLPGFFPMHDDTQPSRVFEMAKGLSFGQFPVRLVPDLGFGFGYPLFNFYAPLPYYIGAVFNLIGFDVISATKMMFIIGIVLSAVNMYFLGRQLVGRWGGITAAVFYLYSPYHAVAIYVRGAVGEFYAFAFLPLIVLGIIKIIKSPAYPKQGIIIGSLGLAGVLLSHNILGMLTGFFLSLGLLIYLIYLLLSEQKLLVICYLLSVICLGLGLSAFFTLPAIAEKSYAKVETLISGGSDFRQHFVYLDQLWNSPWGFAGSAPGREDGMSFKIGKIHLLVGLLSIPLAFYLYKNKRLNNSHSLLLNSCFLILAASIFLMLEPSKPIWEVIPFFPYIQYPWRLLNFTLLSLSGLTVFLFAAFNKRLLQIILALVVIAATILLNAKYFLPKEYISVKSEDYISDSVLRFKISKISDEYLPRDFKSPQNTDQVAWQGIADTSSVKVNIVKETPTNKEYSLSISQPTKIITHIAFFPGWVAYLDGRRMTIKSEQGRIELELPQGTHELKLIFGNTPVRTVSEAISLFCLFLLVCVSLFWGNFTLWKRNIQFRL